MGDACGESSWRVLTRHTTEVPQGREAAAAIARALRLTCWGQQVLWTPPSTGTLVLMHRACGALLRMLLLLLLLCVNTARRCVGQLCCVAEVLCSQQHMWMSCTSIGKICQSREQSERFNAVRKPGSTVVFVLKMQGECPVHH